MVESGIKRQKRAHDIRRFWGTEACGTHFVQGAANDLEFFEEYRRFRYETEWHIPLLVPFSESKGKRVLEIGCGNGADGAMFAANGADYVGVDLTETAVAASRRHFQLLALPGAFQIEDAEALSFADQTFDLVYSYGVLHHTPNPAQAIRELYRVLKPRGQAIVMLYNRRSFNYYIRIMLYMRLRLLLKILARAGRLDSDRARLSRSGVTGLRGNDDPGIWQLHYENFLREGWNYLSADRFVHHATDGPECPYAYVYSRDEAAGLFSDFAEVRFEVAHFPLRKYGPGRLVPFRIEKWLAATMGWYLMIFAQK